MREEFPTSSGSALVPLGKEMRKQFLFAEGWRNLNHGSYGTHPQSVRARLRELQEDAEARPDPFIRFTEPRLHIAARHAVAPLLNVSPADVVFVPNATTGLNTILRNIVYEPGDVILSFSTTYGAVTKTILSVTESTPASSTAIPLLTLPALSTSSILAAVTSTIASTRAAGNRPVVLLLDTIVSQPGMRLPFEALISLCRREGMFSVVDGAHGIGHIPLDLAALDPDFLTTNAHKWLFAPRSCAVLYVPRRNQHLIRTSFPTSAFWEPKPSTDLSVQRADAEPHRTGDAEAAIQAPSADEDADTSRFVRVFSYTGTLDTAAYLSVPAAIAFRRDVCGGEAAVMAYCSDLARRGGDAVAAALGTECLDNEEGSLRKGLALVNVRLPLAVQEDGTELDEIQRGAILSWITLTLINEYKTAVPTLWWGGCFWARLSAQVYLDMSDFEWVAQVLKRICERVGKGEHLEGE